MSPALYRVGAATAAFGLLFGFSTAIIAGVLDGITESFRLTTQQAELTVAILVVSCFAGAVAAGSLSARFGRRRTLGLAVVLATSGYVLVLLDGHFAALLVARVLIGLAVGLTSMVMPMYAGEASPVHLRGAVVSLFQLAITVGMLSAYAAPLLLGAENWQVVVGSGLAVTTLCLATLLLIPESPRWLILQGRGAEAASAADVLGIELPQAPTAHVTGPRASLLTGSTPAVLVMCSALFVLQNLSGIDGVLYYAPHIFTELGLTAGTAALTATLGLGAVNVAATVVALIYVDRVGRRVLLNVGCTVMILGLATAIGANAVSLPLLGLLGLAIFIAAFAISLGPLPYVLMSELFPVAVREKGIAVASATSWLFNALVAASFLSGVELIGLSGVLGIFATVCLIALVLGLLFVPETRGLPLEAIEAKVVGGVPLRWVGRAPAAVGGAAGRVAGLVALCLAAGAVHTDAQAQGGEIRDVIVERNQIIEPYRPPLELQRRIALAVPLDRCALVDLPDEANLLHRVGAVRSERPRARGLAQPVAAAAWPAGRTGHDRGTGSRRSATWTRSWSTAPCSLP